MERYKARFERNRGHFLVVEGDPAIARGDCDDFQLRMLLACEVPGLIKPDLEQIDGGIAFRYSLQGTRMLSHAMRASPWSMSDLMTGLCRLAEVMEDCRMYMLDAERIRLDDDWIFVGDGGWQDLRLVYVPTTDATASVAAGLEKLLVRWMTHVPRLEGAVIQQLLKLVVSPEFTPASVRSYTRRYLADKLGAVAAEPEPNRPDAMERIRDEPLSDKLPSDREDRVHAVDKEQRYPAASEGWRWFQPSTHDPQRLSGLLGHEPVGFEGDEAMADVLSSDMAKRRRIWFICGAAGVSAIGWRLGFAGHPGTSGLLFSLGLTTAAFGAALWLWNPRSRQERQSLVRSQEGEWLPEERLERRQESPAEQDFMTAVPVDSTPQPMETGWLPSSRQAEMTQQLEEPDEQVRPSYYLEWESGMPPKRIPLQESSLVIGRSAEAAKHVDDSHGMSRAHLELLRTRDGWKAKDLGSRNGTLLNEMSMVPYEPYLLQPEDCLVLAESRYRFKRSG